MTHRDPARVRGLHAAILAALWAVVAPAVADAQFTIVAPAAGTRLAAAPDFATDVVGDPWDMNNRDDYSRYEPGEISNFSPLALDGLGHLLGTVSGPDTNLTIQHRGFYQTLYPGRNGRNFPIDTSRFGLLAFKEYSQVANEGPVVYWFHWPITHPSDQGGGGRAASGQTRVGWKIFTVDLAGGNEVGAAGQDWTKHSATSVRIDPTGSAGAVGKQVGLDWVRLVPRDGSSEARTVTVQWTPSAGPYTVSVQELGGDPAETLTLASNVSGTSWVWSYGFLPPGSYRLTVRPASGLSATVDVVVNDPPVLHFTEPDETGGADFATTVLGNPWDMDAAGDVASVGNVTSSSFSGGQLHATSPPGSAGFDSQVLLLNTLTAPAPLIDPSVYHRVTFRMTLDGGFDLGQAGGSVARVFWGSIFNRGDQLTTSDDIFVWPGANSYTIDLATLRHGADQGIEAPGPGDISELWTSAAKRYFRIDPHEGNAGRTWHVDDVKLADDDRPAADGTFTVKWTYTDADAITPPTLILYRDDDRDPGNGKTVIASGLFAADGQYVWDTTGLPDGTYWLFADVTDGLNTTGRYATGPVKIGNVASEICGDCVDNDGNGATDYEDAACCTATALDIAYARFLAGRKGPTAGKLAIQATLVGTQYASADPRDEDVTIQLANQNGTLLCTLVPHTAWRKVKKKVPLQVRFKDKARTAYGGLQQGVMQIRPGGAVLNLTSSRMDISRFSGDLTATVQLGGRCSTVTVPLEKRGKRGYAY